MDTDLYSILNSRPVIYCYFLDLELFKSIVVEFEGSFFRTWNFTVNKDSKGTCGKKANEFIQKQLYYLI